MNEEMREEIASDCGLIVCPFFYPNDYGYCDEHCDDCELYWDFYMSISEDYCKDLNNL